MTKEQIQYLRDTYNSPDPGGESPVATNVFYHIHGTEIVFRNNMDFVIFDDNKELIHAIATNRESNGKHEAPFSILSASYEILDLTEANMTMDSLFLLLDTMFSELITDAQKAQIKNWAEHIPNTVISPVISGYISDDPAEVPPKPVTVGTRADKVYSNGYPVERAPKKASIVIMKASDFLSDPAAALAEGANIFIQEPNTNIEDSIAVDNDNITLNLNKGIVSDTMSVNGDNAQLRNIVYTTAKLDADDLNILTVTGDEFSLGGTEFELISDAQQIAAAVMMNTDSYNLSDSTINCDQHVTNFIDSNGIIKTKKVTIKDCTFKDKAVSQYLFSFYDFVDGAVVSFENCNFTVSDGSNPVRISNKSNAKATINFINCKYKSDSNEKAALVACVDDTPIKEIKTEEELRAFIAEGGKCYVVADIDVTSTLNISGNVNIDLEGHALSMNTGSAGRPIQIQSGADVVIKNGSMGNKFAKSYGIVDNYANLTLKNINVNVAGGDGGAVFRNMANGHMIVNGGTMVNTGDDANQMFRNHAGCENTYLELNNVSITTKGKLDYSIVVRSGECKVNNCSIYGNHGGISLEGGILTVNGSEAVSDKFYGIYVSNAYMESSAIVNGTKFTGNSIDILATAPDGDNQGNLQKGNVNVTINYAECQHEVKLGKYENTKGYTWTFRVNGGIYGADPSAYVDPEFADVIDNGDGTWTVLPKDPAIAEELKEVVLDISEETIEDNDFSKITINCKNLVIDSKVVKENNTSDLSKRIYRLEGTRIAPVVKFS